MAKRGTKQFDFTELETVDLASLYSKIVAYLNSVDFDQLEKDALLYLEGIDELLKILTSPLVVWMLPPAAKHAVKALSAFVSLARNLLGRLQ